MNGPVHPTMYYLFYSTYSPECQTLYQYLKQYEPLPIQVHWISCDDPRVRKVAKAYVQGVPTLMEKNTRRVWVGSHVITQYMQERMMAPPPQSFNPMDSTPPLPSSSQDMSSSHPPLPPPMSQAVPMGQYTQAGGGGASGHTNAPMASTGRSRAELVSEAKRMEQEREMFEASRNKMKNT